jgi:hypothetical protein
MQRTPRVSLSPRVGSMQACPCHVTCQTDNLTHICTPWGGFTVHGITLSTLHVHTCWKVHNVAKEYAHTYQPAYYCKCTVLHVGHASPSHRLPSSPSTPTINTRAGMPTRSAPTNQHGQHVEGTHGIITTKRGEHARMPMPCNMPTPQLHSPTHTMGWFHSPWHNFVHTACTHMLESA